MFIAPEQRRTLTAVAVIVESGFAGPAAYGALFGDTIAQQNTIHTELAGLQQDTAHTQDDVFGLTNAEVTLKAHHLSVPDALGQLILADNGHLKTNQLRAATLQREYPHTPVDEMTLTMGVLALSTVAYIGAHRAVRAYRNKHSKRVQEPVSAQS